MARVVKPFARAARIANSLLIVDMGLTIVLLREAGGKHPLALPLALLAPAWSALVLSVLLTWVKPIRPGDRPRFPENVTYPLLSSALVHAIAVLTCGQSPSIVALGEEAASLALWTHYPYAVLSALAKVIVMTLWVAYAEAAGRANPGNHGNK